MYEKLNKYGISLQSNYYLKQDQNSIKIIWLNMMKSYEIEGVEIQVGKYYSNEYVKQIKGQLQSYKGVKISKKSSQKNLYLVCGYEKDCSFGLNFQIQQFWNTPYYKLIAINIDHNEGCRNYFQAQILKRKRFLQNNCVLIRKIMQNQIKQKGQLSLPKDIFESFLIQQNLNQQDIFGNPYNQHYKNIKFTIKKKFDNIVANQKQKLDIHIHETNTQQNQIFHKDLHKQYHQVIQKGKKQRLFKKISKEEKKRLKRKKLY